MSLHSTTDTINLPLAEGTTTGLGSISYFTMNDSSYVATFDKATFTLTLYTFPSGNIIKAIPLKKWLTGIKLEKTSVCVRNFDSIIICTRTHIVLFDTSSRIKNKIEIPKGQSLAFSNETPLIIKGHILYTNNIKAVAENSLPALKRYKLIEGFDLSLNDQKSYYNLPKVYTSDYYGYSFLRYGYCLNEKGNFVFSFPADTSLYETNLAEYHKSYNARSKFQTEDIKPVSKKDIEDGQSYYEYSIRYSYGPVFYDPAKKWYLRMAKQKLSDSSVYAKNRSRSRSMIILDQNFKIISEAPAPDHIDLFSLFFTRDGQLFARVDNNRKPYVSLVRVEYAEYIDSSGMASLKK
ncbi:DUF4221 family protein [Pseudoflavitalea sp. G-6-1-2]|uniref:DUF4221 family protein n=1 Tax=Pseudoflavitalea sp. G-6-1-2 TaxID=2728841 RepID=UPI001F0E9A1D|nr:DUF4221 family protein [Pseudoflavitalea sp. G-6-1-2]